MRTAAAPGLDAAPDVRSSEVFGGVARSAAAGLEGEAKGEAMTPIEWLQMAARVQGSTWVDPAAARWLLAHIESLEAAVQAGAAPRAVLRPVPQAASIEHVFVGAFGGALDLICTCGRGRSEHRITHLDHLDRPDFDGGAA
jgi:hypothetical protein